MTHMTDQERAEFEAWLGIKPCGAAHDLAWAAWQAARRAQVLPEGWRLLPEDATEEWLTALREKGVRIGSFESLLTDVLAAAPQPPEAAPVQLPEPAAVAFRFETEENGPTETSFYPSDRIGMGWTALYTEAELMAAHGIGKDKA